MKSRLYKRGKTWHASIYYEGKEDRFSTKMLKKFEAQEVLDKRIKELKSRRPGEGEVTLRDLARSYINKCERKQLRSTYMARIHVKHILEFFGEHFKARAWPSMTSSATKNTASPK